MASEFSSIQDYYDGPSLEPGAMSSMSSPGRNFKASLKPAEKQAELPAAMPTKAAPLGKDAYKKHEFEYMDKLLDQLDSQAQNQKVPPPGSGSAPGNPPLRQRSKMKANQIMSGSMNSGDGSSLYSGARNIISTDRPIAEEWRQNSTVRKGRLLRHVDLTPAEDHFDSSKLYNPRGYGTKPSATPVPEEEPESGELKRPSTVMRLMEMDNQALGEIKGSEQEKWFKKQEEFSMKTLDQELLTKNFEKSYERINNIHDDILLQRERIANQTIDSNLLAIDRSKGKSARLEETLGQNSFPRKSLMRPTRRIPIAEYWHFGRRSPHKQADPLSSDIDKTLLPDKVKYSRKINELKAEAKNGIKPVAYRTEEVEPRLQHARLEGVPSEAKHGERAPNLEEMKAEQREPSSSAFPVKPMHQPPPLAQQKSLRAKASSKAIKQKGLPGQAPAASQNEIESQAQGKNQWFNRSAVGEEAQKTAMTSASALDKLKSKQASLKAIKTIDASKTSHSKKEGSFEERPSITLPEIKSSSALSRNFGSRSKSTMKASKPSNKTDLRTVNLSSYGGDNSRARLKYGNSKEAERTEAASHPSGACSRRAGEADQTAAAEKEKRSVKPESQNHQSHLESGRQSEAALSYQRAYFSRQKDSFAKGDLLTRTPPRVSVYEQMTQGVQTAPPQQQPQLSRQPNSTRTIPISPQVQTTPSGINATLGQSHSHLPDLPDFHKLSKPEQDLLHQQALMNVLKDQIQNTQRFISSMNEIQHQRNFMQDLKDIENLNQPEWAKNYQQPVSLQYPVSGQHQPQGNDRIVIQSDSLLEKGELLDSIQRTDMEQKDQIDRLMKDIITKLRKGKIRVDIEMGRHSKVSDQNTVAYALEQSLSRNDPNYVTRGGPPSGFSHTEPSISPNQHPGPTPPEPYASQSQAYLESVRAENQIRKKRNDVEFLRKFGIGPRPAGSSSTQDLLQNSSTFQQFPSPHAGPYQNIHEHEPQGPYNSRSLRRLPAEQGELFGSSSFMRMK